MPSYQEDDTDVSCVTIIISMIIVICHCIHLNELQKTNPDLFWIMLISQ